MGQFEAALQAHEQALQLHYQLANQTGIASAIYNLGDLHRVLGDNSKALSYFLQALELDIATTDRRNIAYSHNKLGYVYSDTGDLAKASFHAQQALSLFEQIGALRDADWARTVVAKIAMEQADYSQAQQLLDAVIQRAAAQQYRSLLVDAYKMAAELALRQKAYQQALDYAEAGIAQAQQNEERADEAQLRKLQVNALIELDLVREALAALQQQKQLEDDLFNSKRVAAIAALQAQTDYTRQQYQLDLLQNTQKLQQTQLEQQRLARNFLLLGLTAAFVLMLSLYRRHVQQQQNRRLEQEVAARTEQLEQKNAELALAYQQLEAISLTDKLTGLHNRRFLESHIEADLEQYRRIQQQWQSGKAPRPDNAELAVFIIDLDHFKALNDLYGHDVGDKVLQQLRFIMQQVFRQSDYLVRWGGEEFIVVARGIQREDVHLLAQRFVTAVQEYSISAEGHKPFNINCSVGYACYPLPLGEPANHWPILLKLADICLYAAKNSGRNGWVGLHSISSELTLADNNITAAQLQVWDQTGQLHLMHSFSGPLHWQN